MITRLKETHGVAGTVGVEMAGCAYSSYKRWKTRLDAGSRLVNKPGPKKMHVLDYNELINEIRVLKHNRKRTQGTVALYNSNKNKISRRELQTLIVDERIVSNRYRRLSMNKVSWLVPNLAWSMDDTQVADNCFIHTLQDMASRYLLPPLTGCLPHGEEVAEHLESLFSDYGAPLFLKRDNGKNLNHSVVNKLLAKYRVIPLNSPGYYPQYNGMVENAQGTIKSVLNRNFPITYQQHNLPLCVSFALHTVNHKARRSLSGKVPCEVYNGPGRVAFSCQERKEAYVWIKEKTLEVLDKMQHINDKTMSFAWRFACELWLQNNGFIAIEKGKKCYPILQ